MTTPNYAPQNALDTLDRHWAVKVVTPEDRAVAIRFAMGVLTRLCSEDAAADSTDLPEFVVPLAGAYVIAASEWLDFEGAASPSAILSEEQDAQRATHVETGADRAFILTAALPVEADERIASLYRALLLAGLAQLGHKQTEFRHWMRAHDAMLFPADDHSAWDVTLLRRNVKLWMHVLRGAGPSGLEQAMEIVASIREDRPIREPEFMATVDSADEGRTRFFLFTLFHLTEAATELLLFRLHGEPERIDAHLYSHFTLARDAAGGDPRLDASFDWLYEASRRIVAQRTAQLELLPDARR
ncbi:MAG TPA: hypothetical protein VGM67_15655 [Gemmatimonadaceae bacterium]|jgi:hypothetical protein